MLVPKLMVNRQYPNGKVEDYVKVYLLWMGVLDLDTTIVAGFPQLCTENAP